MKTVSKDQIKAIYAMIARHKLDKEDVIWRATEGRTSHVSDLTWYEAKDILQAFQFKPGPDDTDRAKWHKANVMRRKIISCCYTMNMTKYAGKIDMDKVNDLIKNKGYLKNKGKVLLNDYTVDELPILVTQIDKFMSHYLTKRMSKNG